MVMNILLLLLLSLSIISAFQFSLSRLPSSFLRLKMSSNCVVGENVPEEVMKLQAVNDMILVERFSSPEQTIGGVYIPKAQGADRKRLGKVISVPTEFSSITNTGRVRSPNELTDLKVGDVIVVEVRDLSFSEL